MSRKIDALIKKLDEKGYRPSSQFEMRDDLLLFRQKEPVNEGLYNVWSLEKNCFLFLTGFDTIDFHSEKDWYRNGKKFLDVLLVRKGSGELAQFGLYSLNFGHFLLDPKYDISHLYRNLFSVGENGKYGVFSSLNGRLDHPMEHDRVQIVHDGPDVFLMLGRKLN